MCGIVGSINHVWLYDPLKALAHRGPDDRGWWEERNIALGHTRLAIQDLSFAGHQPMISKNGRYILVFNGEIYNHWKIRKELIKEKISFNSKSDTETLLAAWQIWGTDCLKKLDGIFAFGILDRHSRILTLVRDSMGVKPLYLYKQGTQFAFSSEIKAFLALKNFDKTIDLSGILNYLSFLWSPGKVTIFKNVKRLLPGHLIMLNIDLGKIIAEIEYQVVPKSKIKNSEFHDCSKNLDALLREAVHSQLISDVPLGFMLSGGLDSSLLVAMARSLEKHIEYPCFAIESKSDGRLDGFPDDIPFAKLVAKHVGAKLHIIEGDSDMLHEFDRMIWHMDEPQADIAPIYVGQIARMAKKQFGCSVLISGTGADDIFSGYRRHIALKYEPLFHHIPNACARAFHLMTRTIPISSPFFRRLRKLTRDWGISKKDRILGLFNWQPNNQSVFELMHPRWKQKISKLNPYEYLNEIWNTQDQDHTDLDRILFLEQKTFLPVHNLNYMDKLSMAESVEVRVPYLANNIVELSTQMPDSFKMKGHQTKYILRKIAEKYLPKEVIHRSKTGFGAPLRHWVVNKSRDFVQERLNTGALTKAGLIDVIQVRKLLQRNQNGKEDLSYVILSILALHSWYDQFIEKIY